VGEWLRLLGICKASESDALKIKAFEGAISKALKDVLTPPPGGIN
jgi:hypothetical protein